MMKSKKESNISWWCGILLGVLASFSGARQLLTGEPGFRGGLEIPAWTGWVQLPFGLWVLFLSIRALKRNWHTPEPPVNLDEEAAKAEAEMDAMYVRDHGELPDKNQKDD